MKKLFVLLLCTIMCVGLSGCGSEKSKNDFVEKETNSEIKNEKKLLKEMIPDPNGFLDRARISYEGYNEDDDTYEYKIEDLTNDEFYKNYKEAVKKAGFNTDYHDNAIKEVNSFNYFAYTEDKDYFTEVYYHSPENDKKGLASIKVSNVTEEK